MDAKKLSKVAIPKTLGGYLAQQAKNNGHGGHSMSSVRTAIHNGHRVSLETMYVVKVDGKKANVSLMVGDDGQVHCHALPNYQFSSALDLIKVIVDQFPDDFPIKSLPPAKRKKAATPKRPKNSKRGM